MGTPASVPCRNHVRIFEHRLLQTIVNNTCRTSQTEQNSVRTLRDRHTSCVVSIESDVGKEV